LSVKRESLTMALTGATKAGNVDTRILTKSREAAKLARAVIPGGVNSNFRKDASFQPLYFSHGKGGRLFDIDGNDYIDFALSYGPAILGHDNPVLQKALVAQAQKLYSPESTELEQIAARKIIQHIPCAELVRFACTGTEANYNAIRLARAYTGKSKFLRFSGHYHGGTDELLGGIAPNPVRPSTTIGEYYDDIYSQMTNTLGRNESTVADTLTIEWNDLATVEKVFQTHGEQIAAVLLEPVMLNNSGCMPLPGYLEGIRALCTQYDAVLIFDEVLTGFRIGLGGAQSYFGITPDMVVLAKALGGGMPVSAFAGKKAIMECLSRSEVVSGGTYNGHPLCMTAVIATLEVLEANNGAVYKQIADNGNRLKTGLLEISDRHGVNLLIQGFPGAWVHNFTQCNQIDNHSDARGFAPYRAAEFNTLLRKNGVLANSRLCISAAHTADDIDEALNRANEAMRQMS